MHFNVPLFHNEIIIRREMLKHLILHILATALHSRLPGWAACCWIHPSVACHPCSPQTRSLFSWSPTLSILWCSKFSRICRTILWRVSRLLSVREEFVVNLHVKCCEFEPRGWGSKMSTVKYYNIMIFHYITRHPQTLLSLKQELSLRI